jgi:hypothetical protein
MIERCGFSVGSVYSRPSSEIQRSLQILQIARGNTAATLPSWARILDKTIGRGHLLLRAFRRSPALRKRGVLIRAARIARIGSQVAAC